MTNRLLEVNAYIEANILHSEKWDAASAQQRIKATNQATLTLERYLPNHARTLNGELEVEDIAIQVLFLLKKNEYTELAEMGIKSTNIDGISVTVDDTEQVLAGELMRKYDISTTKRVKVGSYAVDTWETPTAQLGRRRNRRGWY